MKRTPVVASVLVAGTGVAVLLGWMLGIEAIIRPIPLQDGGMMMPNTAIGLTFLGVALGILRTDRPRESPLGFVGRTLATVAATIGLLTLAEYALRVDLTIDVLLFPDAVRRLVSTLPGRPTPATSISLVASGAAILLLEARWRRGIGPSEILALAAGFLGMESLTGYGYGQRVPAGSTSSGAGLLFEPMAIHTSLAFVILALGILFARPGRGLLSLIGGSDVGSFIARRLLPAAILVPLLLGWLRVAGERAGLYGPEAGSALFAVSTMLVLTLLIAWNAVVVRRVDVARARAESELRRSEARFRSVFERSGIGIVLADAEGRLLVTNSAFQRFLGYAAGELEGKRFTEITHPEDVDVDWELFQELVAGSREAYQIEKRYLTKDGRTVWGRLTGSLVPAGEGKTYGIGMVEDITVQKDLAEERFRLTAIVEATPDFVGTATVDGRVLSLNGAGRQMVGATDADLSAYHLSDFHPPETLSYLLGHAIPAAIRDGVWTGETAILHASGRVIPVSQVILAHRDAAGSVSFLSTVIRDLSDRVRREENERFLLEASRVLAASLDEDEILRGIATLLSGRCGDYCIVDRVEPDGSVRPAIAAAADPERLRAAEEVAAFLPAPGTRPGASSVLRTGRPDTVGEISDLWLKAVATSDAHLAALRRLGPRSQACVPVSAHDRLIGVITLGRTSAGNPFRREDLVTLQEVAWRIGVAIENCRLYVESQLATHTRDEVLRIVAHDLRNPLSTISLAAGSVLHRLPESMTSERRQLELVTRAVDLSNRLIADLLDVARMEAGRLVVEPEPADALALVNETAELQRPLAVEKSLRLEIDLPDELPPIAADRGRLLQVFANLVGNAVKFTPAGGRITIAAEPLDDHVRFSVSDTGPGLTPEEIDRVFDPFWQARPGGLGAGLGLPLARGIVDAHGGHMEVSSGPGTGSTFSFTIPTLKKERNSTPPPTNPKEAASSGV